jgi:hypothetical protein
MASVAKKPVPKKKKQMLDPLEARRRVMVRWKKPGARAAHAAAIRANLAEKSKEEAKAARAAVRVAEAQALAAEKRAREYAKAARTAAALAA